MHIYIYIYIYTHIRGSRAARSASGWSHDYGARFPDFRRCFDNIYVNICTTYSDISVNLDFIRYNICKYTSDNNGHTTTTNTTFTATAAATATTNDNDNDNDNDDNNVFIVRTIIIIRNFRHGIHIILYYKYIHVVL